MDPCYPFQMLLAANQRNPLGVSSHHRWTQVSTLYASSLWSFSPRQHSPALNPAWTARRVFACCCRLLRLLLERLTGCGCPTDGFGRMKSARETETPSYVMTSRTNTRSWVQQGGGEEDGHRRALCGGFTERCADGRARSGRGENRVRSHPPNHSALPSHTPPSRAHYTTDRVHYPTQSPVWRNRTEACGVAVVRVNCPSFSSLCLRVSSAPTPEVLRGN